MSLNNIDNIDDNIESDIIDTPGIKPLYTDSENLSDMPNNLNHNKQHNSINQQSKQDKNINSIQTPSKPKYSTLDTNVSSEISVTMSQ